MITSEEFKKVADKLFQLIEKIKVPERACGDYLCEKITDELTVLQRNGETWKVINDLAKIDKSLQTMTLASVKDTKNGKKLTIAAIGHYYDWPIDSIFQVNIDENGYSKLIFREIDKEAIKKLLKEYKLQELKEDKLQEEINEDWSWRKSNILFEISERTTESNKSGIYLIHCKINNKYYRIG